MFPFFVKCLPVWNKSNSFILPLIFIHMKQLACLKNRICRPRPRLDVFGYLLLVFFVVEKKCIIFCSRLHRDKNFYQFMV